MVTISFIFQREKGVLGGYLAGETGEETQKERGEGGEERGQWGGMGKEGESFTPGMDTNRKKRGIKRIQEKGGKRVKEKYPEGGRPFEEAK